MANVKLLDLENNNIETHACHCQLTSLPFKMNLFLFIIVYLYTPVHSIFFCLRKISSNLHLIINIPKQD